MFTPLPRTSEAFEQLSWSAIEPWYRELASATLTEETLQPWMNQWSHLSALVDETMSRHTLAVRQNISDVERKQRKQRFIDEIFASLQPYEQQIKERLLASGLIPPGFELPLRNLRAEASLYRQENQVLSQEDGALSDEYMQVFGSMKLIWEDQEVLLTSLSLSHPERARRERVWRAIEERRSLERDRFNALWVKQIRIRQLIASNAGYASYRDYRWQQLLRFDYTPAESKAFHALIERVLVPASNQIWEQRRKRLRVEQLRPWDVSMDGRTDGTLPPITDVDALLRQSSFLFQLIDPRLGKYFAILRQEQLLDLQKSPVKALGGYVQALEVKHRPFIFGQVGSAEHIVRTLFHEAGHAFHVFEMAALPFIHQRKLAAVPLEFAEVTSTSMEFIAAMYLDKAGLCSEREAALVRLLHLEKMLANYLPEFIIGDTFQHWVYEHPEEALDLQACCQKWAELNRRYQPIIDWSGLETELSYGWQRIPHFFCYPLYVIEYAFAALGAIQIWRNYLRDPQEAMEQYLHALSLGATKTVPELYTAAGATFTFDETALQEAIQLVTRTMADLETRI
ncbi:peptidase M3 [Ktedonosporobacter rubrisoli]|uniref:Peptidase M3 n=1 Tax=Ktedonosporobacter rubrisoli TaxID=2509675 RepID=A0A4P6JK89_KTERU|nr:M3 family oligoendopeptidase [Ktedonosporobacter rubrisoli]QBD75046.1 peptidase M3 [Ktedonosporobacter rubrisoli]